MIFKKAIIIILCLITAILFSFTCANANPFVSGNKQSYKEDSASKNSNLSSFSFRFLRDNSLYRSLVAFQRSFNNQITSTISNYRNQKDLDLLLYVCLIAIGYGFIHALMPGHGKNIILAGSFPQEENIKKWLLQLTFRTFHFTIF